MILEAVAGPVSGRRIEVKPGTTLTIGRTARSNYEIPQDGYLSSQHFAVVCEGELCRIRDLGSTNGTFVNEDRIVEQVVQHGDLLTAGGSTFVIDLGRESPAPAPSARTVVKPAAMYVTTLTPPLDDPGAPREAHVSRAREPKGQGRTWRGFSKAQHALLRLLYDPGLPVFTVLDGSKDTRIPAFLEAAGEPYLAVDPSGRLPVFVAAPAPHSKLLDVLIKDGWGNAWCSYFMAETGLQEACGHLSSFLRLYSGRGKPMTFRYWDAKILRGAVPLMMAEDAVSFAGPFTRIVLEADTPEIAVELTATPQGFEQRTVTLA